MYQWDGPSKNKDSDEQQRQDYIVASPTNGKDQVMWHREPDLEAAGCGLWLSIVLIPMQASVMRKDWQGRDGQSWGKEPMMGMGRFSRRLLELGYTGVCPQHDDHFPPLDPTHLKASVGSTPWSLSSQMPTLTKGRPLSVVYQPLPNGRTRRARAPS